MPQIPVVHYGAGACISAIAAIDSRRALGRAGGLPWDIPEDVAYFEAMVAGGALVVGRLTYFTMPEVPPHTYVVSRDADLPLRGGAVRVGSVEAGLACGVASGRPVYVIGGAGIYEAAWPYCQYLYLTRIEGDFGGDAFFPALDLQALSILADSTYTLVERMSGKPVSCRFSAFVRERVLEVPSAFANTPHLEQNRP